MRYPEIDEGSDVAEEGNQFTKQRKCERHEFVDVNEEGKWKPFWQRGHTTLDEVNLKIKQKERTEKHLKLLNKKTKMYHSNTDLRTVGRGRPQKRVKISKSVSLQGLNRMPTIESAKLGEKNQKQYQNRSAKLSRTNSTLNLPRIDPDIEITGDSGSRGSSAVTNGVLHSANVRFTDSRDMEDEKTKETEDDDVYLSDDDPAVSRQNLDKAGDYIVDHDWILQENLAKEARKVNSKHKKIQIILPDEDPLETIKTRMEEITMMVKPKAEFGNFIDTIDPEQRERIMKYKEMEHTDIRNAKRKNWTGRERFRDAVKLVLILYRACHPRQKYLADDKPDTAPDGVKKIKQTTPLHRDLLAKSSLGHEMQLSLSTQSDHRTPDDIKRIMWMLRATKAFKHLFPAQLEEQLASVVAYERYDTRRIVAQQGRDPERFYYILTGKLTKVREYRLLSGVVTRDEGFIEKGNTTDPQEMSQNWPREHHLVTKGNVEVLILEKSDYLDLLHTCKGPPIEFLQGLDLFKEFPCEEFRHNPDAIDFKYYGQDNVIVKDTNRTQWLHVVKTGHVKVVRVQTVIDVQNEDKFSGQPTDELGCVRPFSHASAMLGLLSSQRKMKTMVGAISFPEEPEEASPRPTFDRSQTEYFFPEKQQKYVSKDNSFDNPLTRRFTTRRPSLVAATNNAQTQESESPSPFTMSKKKSKGLKSANFAVDDTNNEQLTSSRLADITERGDNSANSKRSIETPKLVITSPLMKSPISPLNGVHSDSPDKLSREKTFFLPPINDGHKIEKTGEFIPHGTYLTREKTEFDQIYNKKPKKEVVHRTTHLQLDVLKPGDIFGLDGVAALFRSKYPVHDRFGGLEHLEPQALASEGPGVTLISDGAEIIKISKRFFLQHAQNNTMLKVETMQREYMSTDEAKTVMYNKETWRQYKSVLLQRTVNNLHRNQVEKVP